MREQSFVARHVGPTDKEIKEMLSTVGASTLEQFIKDAIPEEIRESEPLKLSDFQTGVCESTVLRMLSDLASTNKAYRSFIGCGYYGTHTPSVIRRNVFENPGWYTQYTPYQPEISQGRLEALLNFQTMVSDLTGLPVANASLLDEGTAVAEAVAMCVSSRRDGNQTVFLSQECHPQTIAVVKTRAEALGYVVEVVAEAAFLTTDEPPAAVVYQYPGTQGGVTLSASDIENVKGKGTKIIVACDLLALLLLKSPGELGADVAVGSSQRFGIPLGFGGPHAGFLSTTDEFKRKIPGRLVGVSIDSHGAPAIRLALQTREQHIRREKATSNICTAQVLLAVMAGMYAVYHGREGLKSIASRVHRYTRRFAEGLKNSGYTLGAETFFDTLKITCDSEKLQEVRLASEKLEINLRYESGAVLVSFDELTTEEELSDLASIFGISCPGDDGAYGFEITSDLLRSDTVLSAEVFRKYRTETEFLRYVKSLEAKDLSLCTSMIPLGSCTMKLNAAAEMLSLSLPGFASLHPFVPPSQAKGYTAMIQSLEKALAEITGFSACSLQPNAGSQGEFAGLLAIRAYHLSRGDSERTVCLIPRSAHGTNPASAVMAGMKVVVVECDKRGDIDLEDLKAKATTHRDSLAALMVTYPSTHGVFESHIMEVTTIIHDAGGQVYMDGANLNALVGLVKPATLGMDVCHINLHKTFCIPHGGGGPGVGPIAVASHLAPFLPDTERGQGGSPVGPVSAAPYGSASILTISWAYIALMGAAGLTKASEVAILNANYIAKRLEGDYNILFKGESGYVAHECIVDLRPLKQWHIEVNDIAKRLIDYGFHAPTVSWPVAGTIMIEPTESESKEELDRFCDAMKSIRDEVRQIETGELPYDNNMLVNAPHTALAVISEAWDYPYSREVAAFPTEWTRSRKFWPATGRIDSVYGDRNLVCSCPSVDSYEK